MAHVDLEIDCFLLKTTAVSFGHFKFRTKFYSIINAPAARKVPLGNFHSNSQAYLLISFRIMVLLCHFF